MILRARRTSLIYKTLRTAVFFLLLKRTMGAFFNPATPPTCPQILGICIFCVYLHLTRLTWAIHVKQRRNEAAASLEMSPLPHEPCSELIRPLWPRYQGHASQNLTTSWDTPQVCMSVEFDWICADVFFWILANGELLDGQMGNLTESINPIRCLSWGWGERYSEYANSRGHFTNVVGTNPRLVKRVKKILCKYPTLLQQGIFWGVLFCFFLGDGDGKEVSSDYFSRSRSCTTWALSTHSKCKHSSCAIVHKNPYKQTMPKQCKIHTGTEIQWIKIPSNRGWAARCFLEAS